MGQYWMVINLDKRQHLGKWGKLGEFLCSGLPSSAGAMLTHPSLKDVEHDDSWVGDRIICVGDYIEDYPLSLLTDDERKELDESDGSLYSLAEEEYKQTRPHGFYAKYSRVNVLRNHTKQVYVRQDQLPKTEYDMGEPPTLSGVLLSRICWSSDPSSSMRYDGNITRGVWAGDRFDIVPLDLVEEEMKNGANWEDVSKEVAEEIQKIWESEFNKRLTKM